MNKLATGSGDLVWHVAYEVASRSLIMATVYGSEMFPFSLIHSYSFYPSSTTGVHASLYIWCSRIQLSNSRCLLIIGDKLTPFLAFAHVLKRTSIIWASVKL